MLACLLINFLLATQASSKTMDSDRDIFVAIKSKDLQKVQQL